MIERVFAALVIAVCAVLLLRLMLGARRRHRFDAALRRAGVSVQRGFGSVRHTAGRLRRWRITRRDAAEAARVADDVIRRARDRGAWDGNVYKPKSFRKPPRDKTH